MRSLLIFTLSIALSACDKSDAPQPQASRVIAVTTKAKPQDSLAEFCDVSAIGGQKRQFRLPETTGVRKQTANSFRWVNIWATWCKPCIEEMPMLVQWQKRLKDEGVVFDLEFVSVDETFDTANAFLKKHSQLPRSLHLKDPDALPSWIEQMGLDSAAGLPIHVFIDPKAEIRCVRAAAITPGDYATVARLLQ
jgi:thiol-disulfide isomerase/thioredoxin